MAEMARAKKPKQSPQLGEIPGDAAGLSIVISTNRALSNLTNPQTRGTVCLNWARTDLWGASSGHRARRPYPGPISGGQ